jgi:putative methyltransferase (TIGR04325 family)
MDKQLKIWDGVFKSFAEAGAEDAVFEGEVWLEKIRGRASEAIASSHSDSTIQPVAETRDYALPFVAALAARPKRTLRILDFGGGMATSYIPLVKMLPADQPLEYVIVENEAVCREGCALMADDYQLSFRSSVPEQPDAYDIVHCGSSLQYVEDWREMLKRFAALNPMFVLFADLPAGDNVSFVTRQFFHGRRIPVHFWSLREFILTMETVGYDLLLKARYLGPYLEPGGGLPTGHFDSAHRLAYSSQLIFRRAGAV